MRTDPFWRSWKLLLAGVALGALAGGLVGWPDDRRPVVEFIGHTHVLNRRVARFAISNPTDRAFLVTTSPTNGFLPTPVEPHRTGYVDVPNPLTNRIWSAGIQFQFEAPPWRAMWEETRRGRIRQAGAIARASLGTNQQRYFIARRALDVSVELKD